MRFQIWRKNYQWNYPAVVVQEIHHFVATTANCLSLMDKNDDVENFLVAGDDKDELNCTAINL